MPIQDEILQTLLDTAYRLSVEVHYEDVPAWGVEMPLIQILRTIKQDFGLEPTNYGLVYGDPEQLLGE